MRNWLSTPDAKNEYCFEGNDVWIKLTQGKETVIDLGEWNRVKGYRWCAHRHREAFYAHSQTSDVTKKSGKRTLRLHRILMGGSTPEIDHRDLDGLNNRGENLRPCTRSQNQGNRMVQRNNVVGFRGVRWHKRTQAWEARLTRRHLGSFSTAEEAAHAYDRAAKQYFGEFARLNFPEQDLAKAA